MQLARVIGTVVATQKHRKFEGAKLLLVQPINPDDTPRGPALLATDGACLLLAADESGTAGYLLGFRHLTFYANGPVAWVEEVVVRGHDRGQGIGRALMGAFEDWAAAEGCAMVALATRRAAPFYHALGYEESAAYFRKVLAGQARP